MPHATPQKESDARTHRTSCEMTEDGGAVSRKLWDCARVLAPLFLSLH
jgi:hypothetical protein